MKNFTCLISLSFIFISTHAAAAECNQDNVAKKLQEIEIAQLLQNAPTFKHGLDSGAISLSFENISNKDGYCSSELKLTLPQNDINEVNLHLDQYPAKRILLGAQGYRIPETTVSSASFYFELGPDGSIKPLNNKNISLKDLHQSVQYIYELLAQLRAAFNPNQMNQEVWSTELSAILIDTCKAKLTAKEMDLNLACQCQEAKIRQRISPYKMALIDYVNNQPYSAATGTLNSYLEFTSAVNRECGLKK